MSEVYDCVHCDERLKTLDCTKEHMRKNHEEFLVHTFFYHLKIARENFREVKRQKHMFVDV